MKRIFYSFLILTIYLVSFTSCATMRNKRYINNYSPIRIDSVPSGASYTVFDKSGNVALKGITPGIVNWDRDYANVSFELVGYSTQTAKLRRDKFNHSIWTNLFWGIVGAGFYFYEEEFDPILHDHPEDADRMNEIYDTVSYGFFGLSAFSILLDIFTGNIMRYSDNITVDFNKRTGSLFRRSTGIETTIERAIQDLTPRLERNARIAIIDIAAPNNVLKDYLTGETEFKLVNRGFRVVDRIQLDTIRAEQRFQLSGEVDESSAVDIGRLAGADYILTGRIDGEGDLRRFRMRILNVETADVIGNVSVQYGDSRITRSRNTLNSAIILAARQATSSISKDSRIAIVSVSAHYTISDYIFGESEHTLVNSGFRVVARTELDRIRNEQRFQLSGEVDDSTAVELGRIAGADYIINIRADGQGGLTRLRWRVLNTQTAEVQGVASIPYND